MNDTDPKMKAKMIEMIVKKTPEQRLAMGCSMYDFAKQLATSSILQKNPGISRTDLKQELLLRFYGQDFDETERKKILTHLIKKDS